MAWIRKASEHTVGVMVEVSKVKTWCRMLRNGTYRTLTLKTFKKRKNAEENAKMVGMKHLAM